MVLLWERGHQGSLITHVAHIRGLIDVSLGESAVEGSGRYSAVVVPCCRDYGTTVVFSKFYGSCTTSHSCFISEKAQLLSFFRNLRALGEVERS